MRTQEIKSLLLALMMSGFAIHLEAQVVSEKKIRDNHKANIKSVNQYNAKKRKGNTDTTTKKASHLKTSRTGKTAN